MMLPSVLTGKSVLAVTDVLAWIVLAAFLGGVLAEVVDRRRLSRALTAGAWSLFAVFWLLLIQFYAFVHKSIVETALVAIAVPACLYVGWRLLQGRESLLVLSRAVAFMGLIYLPFETSTVARNFLIETVAWQTTLAIDAVGLGGGMELIEYPGPESSLVNTFWFPATGRSTHIVFACTGIGSMAIFGGLIAAVDAPHRRKAVGLVASIPIIWVLNIARNAFIAVSNGYTWFDYAVLEDPIMFAFGLSDPAMVSFYVADRVISQFLAVFALIGLAWYVSRWVPELLDLAEELLFLLTGNEVSLRAPRAAPDGGERQE